MNIELLSIYQRTFTSVLLTFQHIGFNNILLCINQYSSLVKYMNNFKFHLSIASMKGSDGLLYAKTYVFAPTYSRINVIFFFKFLKAKTQVIDITFFLIYLLQATSKSLFKDICAFHSSTNIGTLINLYFLFVFQLPPCPQII